MRYQKIRQLKQRCTLGLLRKNYGKVKRITSFVYHHVFIKNAIEPRFCHVKHRCFALRTLVRRRFTRQKRGCMAFL